MLKKLQAKLKCRKGMTMVNVLVAFALLLFILLMFQRTVTLSSNIFQRSEDLRRKTESLYAEFYKTTVYKEKDGSGSTQYIFVNENDNSQQFVLNSKQGEFENQFGSVYYFGNRKNAEGGE